MATYLDRVKAAQSADLADIANERRQRRNQGKVAKPTHLDGIKTAAKPDEVQAKAKRAKPIVDTSTPKMDFAHYKAEMAEDIIRLSALGSIDERTALKRELVGKYTGYVQAYVDAGEKYNNPVAVWVAIWLFDLRMMEPAIKLALHLIAQGIHTMPHGFKRTLPVVVCDETYDWAAELLKKEESARPYLDWVVEAMQAGKWQLHPAVESKTFVMLAKHCALEGDTATALALCQKAEASNPDGHGTKTFQAKLRKTS